MRVSPKFCNACSLLQERRSDCALGLAEFVFLRECTAGFACVEGPGIEHMDCGRRVYGLRSSRARVGVLAIKKGRGNVLASSLRLLHVSDLR